MQWGSPFHFKDQSINLLPLLRAVFLKYRRDTSSFQFLFVSIWAMQYMISILVSISIKLMEWESYPTGQKAETWWKDFGGLIPQPVFACFRILTFESKSLKDVRHNFFDVFLKSFTWLLMLVNFVFSLQIADKAGKYVTGM